MQKLIRLVKSTFHRVRRAWLAQARAFARRKPVLAGTVLYESFSGNGALDNPEAMFRALLAAPDQQHLRHYWVLDKHAEQDAIRAEFAHDPRVQFIRYRSTAYHRLLCRAEVLINNATFPPEFDKRPEQTYVNTWHGTPLKRMGYDMPNGGYYAANTQRNFLHADVLLSQNPFMTEVMYEHAYKLRGAFRGVIAELGYPRVDRQTLAAGERSELLARLAKAGIEIGERKIVLLAPTWKGTNFSNPEDDAAEMFEQARRLQALLGDAWRVLLKVHQSAHQYASARSELRGLLVPNQIPTNQVLGLVDALVTDFSSIFFDYLATGKPILFHMPGLDQYEAERGLYFSIDELPGPVHLDIEGIATDLLGTTGGLAAKASVRQHWQERFTADEDGRASERVIDLVFRGKRDGLRLLDVAEDGRISVLMYLGGMRSNGITTSALNLLRNIDHDRFNVSAMIVHTRRGQPWVNQALIDPHVRQVRRIGGMNGGKWQIKRYKMQVRLAGERRSALHAGPYPLLADELHRIVGDMRFDAVVDFSGYSAFWTALLLQAPERASGGRPRHAIWLHNDLASEVRRTVNGKQPMRRSLPAVFSFFEQHDALVSVSPTLAEVNRQRLTAEYGVPDRGFTHARNLVDAERVLAGLQEPLAELSTFPRDPETGAIERPDWAEAMLAGRDLFWFVTVGRFSTEKNQERLLRAFAKVALQRPEARLVLVGYGPLQDHLLAVRDRLGLGDKVFLTGALRNPFAVLANSHCFVLSSNYEGQPMVLLEAALARLPIVSTRFASVADALPEGMIRIVEQDDDALAEGLLAAIRGEVRPAELDADAYNREVVDEFVRAAIGDLAATSLPQSDTASTAGE